MVLKDYYLCPPTESKSQLFKLISESLWKFEDSKDISVPKFSLETEFGSSGYRITNFTGPQKHVAALILFLFYSNCDSDICQGFQSVLKKFKNFSPDQSCTTYDGNMLRLSIPVNPNERNLHENDLGKLLKYIFFFIFNIVCLKSILSYSIFSGICY